MLRIIALLLLLLQNSALRAEGMPRLDINAICRAAPRLEASDQNTYQNCVRDETEARNQLEQQWAGFDDHQRKLCSEETMVGGAPSYVDVLTCIQMARTDALPGRTRHPAGDP